MIYDSLENIDLYAPIHPLMPKAIEFIKNLHGVIPPEKIAIQGDDLFALGVNIDTADADSRPFEAHKEYIDIQIMFAGQERIDVSLEKEMPITKPYDKRSDGVLFDAAGHYCSLPLTEGTFALFFPQDKHRPGCNLDGPCTPSKLVVKLRISTD